jgi:two-component system chemotaxis response regulator CheY
MSTADTPKILVVDDAPVVRLYHRQILEQAGYAVAEAENGMVALEMATRETFDLCIVDVNMPVMDGYAFLHSLRAAAGINAIPALMISTEAAAPDRTRAMEAGANGYLVKPVPRESLCSYAAAMLGRTLP